MKPLGIYIHIPFCARKCPYCDFVSFAGQERRMQPYIEAVLREAALYAGAFTGHTADTVYIGGGTPSLLSEGEAAKLLAGLAQSFHIAPDAQITIEANPGTVNKEKLSEYKAAGINRLSLGLQSDDDSLLQTLGRIHTYADFLVAYEQAREAGFTDVSLDLMFGLPGQTPERFGQTVENTIALKPEHISAYTLKIEEGTAFHRDYAGREIVDERTERRMYHTAVRLLKNAGYRQYETSNFAQKGRESRHNLKYWRTEETLGLGVAAHSYIIEDGNPVRSCNTESLDRYFEVIEKNQRPISEKSAINAGEQMEEYLMLRLRLKEGIRFSDFKDRFGMDFQNAFREAIEKTAKAGLIHADETGIRPLLRGFDLQNTLICEFMKKL